jgi:NADPH:quinone reductase-like Zn-dependent oxidoreductase
MAWNAFHGVSPLKLGEVVLRQGAGGVSIFALQFTKSAGALVIATAFSEEKVVILKEFAADFVINYKGDLD